MSESKTLDRLILADVLLALLSVAWSAAAAPPRPSGLAFILWMLVCATTVGAWIGLLRRLRPARTLYAASWLGYLGRWFAAITGADPSEPTDWRIWSAAAVVGALLNFVTWGFAWGAARRAEPAQGDVERDFWRTMVK